MYIHKKLHVDVLLVSRDMNVMIHDADGKDEGIFVSHPVVKLTPLPTTYF